MLWLLVPAALLLFCLFCRFENGALVTTQYTVADKDLPEGLDGLVLAQVSDLHDRAFGRGQKRLLAAMRACAPDLILVTGDLVNGRPMGNALKFIEGAAAIAPLYFVPGNHEAHGERYMSLRPELQKRGAILLEERAVYPKEGLRLCGVLDPRFHEWEPELLPRLAGKGQGEFRVLLSHRPERLEAYASAGFDLVFCGHAHGGQFRLPGVGGLYAPDQGIFPRRTAGIHTMGKTRMVVSRGLGNSSFPLRLNNRPELVAVRLTRGEN